MKVNLKTQVVRSTKAYFKYFELNVNIVRKIVILNKH